MSLQEVMKSNALAEAVFKALALRDRFRTVTDLRRLYNDVDKILQGEANIEDFREVIRNMEKAGLGQFVAGRKNNPDRFKWTNKGVAKSVREGKLDNLKLRPKVEAPVTQAAPTEAAGPDLTETKSFFKEAIGTITMENAITYINIKVPLHIPMETLQPFLNALKSLQPG